MQSYFKLLFDGIIDGQDRTYITVEEFEEALGGKDIIENNKRLVDLFWQSSLILDGKIQF